LFNVFSSFYDIIDIIGGVFMRLLLVEDEKRMAQAPQQDGQSTQKSAADSLADNKEKSQPNEQSSISASSYIEVGVSVLVLALGLAFAVLFKRRK